jgi:anaerobic selenocysteine-containing dehydrogenase
VDDLQRLTKGKIPGEATGIEVRKSVCTICDPATQCGLDCYVKDGRIIKVEGSKENPHSAGTLCTRGAAQRQWIYHEDRLLTPLKRVGHRGSGEFVPISWAEAPAETSAAVRLTQLLHRVEHLPCRPDDGLAPALRAGHWAGYGQRHVGSGVDRQPRVRRYSYGAQVGGGS